MVRNMLVPARSALALLLPLTLAVPRPVGVPRVTYDLVIQRGRVIDPESKLDAIRSIGITGGKIVAVSAMPLSGRVTIDAKGLVVAPGFIDLHLHGQDDENYRVVALDGVTTALELELGTGNVDPWYAERDGKALINYGVSIGHIKVRMDVFHDPGPFLPSGDGGRQTATLGQVEEIKSRIERGLQQGGLGVGMGLQYTPAATRWEALEAFRMAAKYRAPVFVHTRSWGETEPGSSVEAVNEVIGDAAISGAALHIVHINSTSLTSTPKTLSMVADARRHGLDVTTEAYPYTAGMTAIESALIDRFEDVPDSVYAMIQWVPTGERLTRESFHRYRKQSGSVILHLNTPEMEAVAITSPLTAIASDGMLVGGKGHPRTAGTFARVLAYYVRETKKLTLMDAIRKMTLLPAERLEKLAPAFKAKGRLKAGADADLVVFDAERVRDRSTYAEPALPSEGFRYVVVHGVPIVRDGKIVEGVHPGRAARAPIH